MALTLNQQTFELIKKSQFILIACKRDWTGDSLAGCLALAQAIKKLGKTVDVVCQDFKPTANLTFLPAAEIKPQLANLQKFIISIDTSKTQVGEFYYDKPEGKLNIYVTPRDGQIEEKDVTTSTSGYRYDLIFVVNSPDLESLGSIYDKQADFFYATPKVNIDNSNKNEYFGNINLINIASSSTCELIYDLIKEFNETLIDENIATYLLAGIIMATKNFKTSNVTPKTLSLSSLLIAKGARREQIIQNLYQNRFLSTLKLWGRVLSRLNNDLDDKLVWSVLSAQDFVETSTTPDELNDVIDELIVSMPKTEIIVLLYETAGGRGDVKVIVYSTKHLDPLFLTQKFNPLGNREIAKFDLHGTDLAQAERNVIDEIKRKLPYQQ